MDEPQFSLPLIRTRRDILGAGLDDNDIRRAVAAGQLIRIRRGCYAEAGPAEASPDEGGPAEGGPAAGDARERAAKPRQAQDADRQLNRPVKEPDQPLDVGVRVAGVVARFGDGVVFSHATAAELWGLPFLGTSPQTTHLTIAPTGHGDRRGMVHRHPAALVPEEVLTLQGIRVTSLPRTLVDVARSEGFQQGVVMADHALHASRDPERLRRDMLSSIGRLAGAAGIGAARRMASFAAREAESPGESLSRIIFSDQGIPTPRLQYRLRIRSPGGQLVDYRTDFAWEGQRVVGEFDGKLKYERFAGPGESPGDVVFREKRREDALRAADWRVVRWTWSELDNPRRLAQKVRAVLDSRS